MTIVDNHMTRIPPYPQPYPEPHERHMAGEALVRGNFPFRFSAGFYLGSTSLKMAAGSTLNGAYVYPDRHLYGESERGSFTAAKGERNMCTQATDVTVVPETSRTCGHQKVVPKHVDKTASDILEPLWSEI